MQNGPTPRKTRTKSFLQAGNLETLVVEDLGRRVLAWSVEWLQGLRVFQRTVRVSTYERRFYSSAQVKHVLQPDIRRECSISEARVESLFRVGYTVQNARPLCHNMQACLALGESTGKEWPDLHLEKLQPSETKNRHSGRASAKAIMSTPYAQSVATANSRNSSQTL